MKNSEVIKVLSRIKDGDLSSSVVNNALTHAIIKLQESTDRTISNPITVVEDLNNLMHYGPHVVETGPKEIHFYFINNPNSDVSEILFGDYTIWNSNDDNEDYSILDQCIVEIRSHLDSIKVMRNNFIEGVRIFYDKEDKQ